jgi:hypothetical protein
MSKLIEEINNLINKIDENFSKNLNQNEVQKLLNDIDDKLVEVEENAEEKQKEIVSKKVEELREKVDEGLTKK